MGWLGPQTGARDGAKEYKAQTNVPRGKTNSNWKAEEQNARRADKKARREAARAAKQAQKKGWLT